MMTYEELYKWDKDGLIITQEEYLTIEEIIRESINRICEAKINGSKEFNKATGKEIDMRRDLMQKKKIRWLAFKKKH